MTVCILEEKFQLVDQSEKQSTVLLLTESDLESGGEIEGVSLDKFSDLYGKAIDHSLYPLSLETKTFVFKYNVDRVKKENILDFYDVGAQQLDMICGGLLSQDLISSKYFQPESVVRLVASKKIKEQVKFGSDFLTGLRIKSVGNKVNFTGKPNKTEKRNLAVGDLFEESDVVKSDHYIEAMILTKSLVNTPANFLNPDTYEQFAIDHITELKERGYPVDIEVYDRSKLQNDGAGLILAVGKASQHPPRIIKMTFRPQNPRQTLSLIGKGITYDTGGLNLKPGSAMRHMKKDMGGSASVYGSFLLAVLLERNIEIDAYLAIAENVVSSNSARPGDVYVALNGKSVEIDNTDAEGRLVLADAVTYASREKRDYMFDFATLTGAARIALGSQVDACLCNDKELAELIDSASLETGDWVWRQPRVANYKSYLDSKIANMENTGGRFAGAITAGMFIEQFHDSKRWAHIDTWMWADKPTFLTKEPGPTPKLLCFFSKLLDLIESQES